MKLGVLLVSHGDYAKASLGALEMLTGPQENVQALGLYPGDTAEVFQRKFADTLDGLSAATDQVMVLADLQGGTPYNTAVASLAHGSSFIGYAGFNIPVLLELMFSRDSVAGQKELCSSIETTFTSSLAKIEFSDVEDDEDE